MNFDKVIGCKCGGLYIPCTRCECAYNDAECRGTVEDLDGEYVYEGEGVN